MNSRQTTRAIMQLALEFETARRAFELEAQPGWDRASADLREALRQADQLGAEAASVCPLAWLTSAVAQANYWLAARPDVRRGITVAVAQTLRVLVRFVDGSVAETEAPHGVGVR